MDATITDVATATAALNKSRDDLTRALDNATLHTNHLRDSIVRVRPLGVLTVDQMAEAIGRERNYVDSVWSAFGDTTKGKQTRVAVAVQPDSDTEEMTYAALASDAHNQRGAANTVGVIRAERDRIVAMVYGSKILGPSAIAAAVGIDRNHVLRIARKSNVKPVWRAAGTARNQHTAA